jgi:hypothetical protein
MFLNGATAARFDAAFTPFYLLITTLCQNYQNFAKIGRIYGR